MDELELMTLTNELGTRVVGDLLRENHPEQTIREKAVQTKAEAAGPASLIGCYVFVRGNLFEKREDGDRPKGCPLVYRVTRFDAEKQKVYGKLIDYEGDVTEWWMEPEWVERIDGPIEVFNE